MYQQSLHDDYITLQMYQSDLLKHHGGYSKIQDDGLLYKFNKIHKRLEELKHLLGMEKEQLEREKLQTQSLYCIPDKGISPRPPVYHPHESYSYPSTYPYVKAPVSTVVDWTNYIVTPNYEYEGYINDLPPNLCSTLFRPHTNEIRGDPQTIGLYRGHLEDVEKMCNQELQNMESSLMNLRRIRRDWNCNELHAAIAPPSRKTKHVRRKKIYYYKDYY